MKSILPLFILLALFTSCKSSYWYTEIHPEKVAFRADDTIEFTEADIDDLVIRTAFIGHAIDYSIFQLDIQNSSDNPISLSYSDVRLVHEDGFQRNAHHKYNFIKNLQTEKKKLKKQKRASTIGNILLGGLTIAAIAAGGGAVNSINAITYGAESAVYISDDVRSFNAMEGSIEEEIAYIEDWVLFETIIARDDKMTKDVIFPNEDLNDDFSIELMLNGKKHLVPYECILKEGRR